MSVRKLIFSNRLFRFSAGYVDSPSSSDMTKGLELSPSPLHVADVSSIGLLSDVSNRVCSGT